MKMNFTQEEYLLLIDMLYLSDWIMHSHEVGRMENEYKKLRKKILASFKEMGANDRIEYSKIYDDYFELQSYHSNLQEKFVKPYDQRNFWDELGKFKVWCPKHEPLKLTR